MSLPDVPPTREEPDGEPIRVGGGHFTCTKCGKSYHASELHPCNSVPRPPTPPPAFRPISTLLNPEMGGNYTVPRDTPPPAAETEALLDKAEADMRALNVWDYSLKSISADGVQGLIVKLRAAVSRLAARCAELEGRAEDDAEDLFKVLAQTGSLEAENIALRARVAAAERAADLSARIAANEAEQRERAAIHPEKQEGDEPVYRYEHRDDCAPEDRFILVGYRRRDGKRCSGVTRTRIARPYA